VVADVCQGRTDGRRSVEQLVTLTERCCKDLSAKSALRCSARRRGAQDSNAEPIILRVKAEWPHLLRAAAAESVIADHILTPTRRAGASTRSTSLLGAKCRPLRHLDDQVSSSSPRSASDSGDDRATEFETLGRRADERFAIALAASRLLLGRQIVGRGSQGPGARSCRLAASVTRPDGRPGRERRPSRSSRTRIDDHAGHQTICPEPAGRVRGHSGRGRST
jgi:hypothetical protein